MDFHTTTVIVGPNNAGKSTIVEALRLVSIVAARYRHINFSEVPKWLDIRRNLRGIKPSLKGMEINFNTMFFEYSEPPAIIKALFHSGEQIEIYLGEKGEIFAVIFDSTGKPIKTRGKASNTYLPTIGILPQIGPLSRLERTLTPGYVRSAIASSLSSLHFRNQLSIFYSDFFADFCKLVESSWKHLKVLSLEGRGQFPGEELALIVRDDAFAAEVSWMGHGLQMWLQIIWFLTYSQNKMTIILDEPDVYLHADLQRKLIRFLRGRSPQIIIATHSTEIMAEVEPGDILIANRFSRKSRFVNSLSAVQNVIDRIGSIHNIYLARLWLSKRFILVEGKDLKFLKLFQDVLHPRSDIPFDIIPHMSIGGWGGWNYVVGSSMFLKNAGGEDIVTYCLLDSDYHTGAEIADRYDDARSRGVQLHIWKFKEIENYLLVPEAIHRYIGSKSKRGERVPEISTIRKRIDKIAKKLKDKIFDTIANEFYIRDRKRGISNANKKTRKSWGQAEN